MGKAIDPVATSRMLWVSTRPKAQEVAELNEAIAKAKMPVCTENLIRVDDVMESLKLAE